MKNQFGYIYRVTNLLNERTYIGQRTGEFDKRYLGSGTAIKHAIAKYGRRSFMVMPIQSAFSRDELDHAEKMFISQERKDGNPYNITAGGFGASGMKLSDSTKQKIRMSLKGRAIPWAAKISKSMKGRQHPREVIDRISAKRRGHKMHDNTKRALIEANTGKRPTAETRLKLSAWQIGRKMSEEAKANWRAANAGRKNTEEYKLAHSIRMKAYFAERRAQGFKR